MTSQEPNPPPEFGTSIRLQHDVTGGTAFTLGFFTVLGIVAGLSVAVAAFLVVAGLSFLVLRAFIH